MIGIILAAVSTLASEVAESVGKHKVARLEVNVYQYGLLLNLGGFLVILAIGLFAPKGFVTEGFPAGFMFSVASLPTLSIRVVLEMLQVYLSLQALILADRSTQGFLRTLTLPILLLADLFLGYALGIPQIIGIILIVGSLSVFFARGHLWNRGALFALLSAINAAITLSLFKHDITYFNSVEAEQCIVLAGILMFLLFMSIRNGVNPFSLLSRPVYVAQLFLSGFAEACMSFAYLFAPASVITAGKRAFAVLWSILSGRMYFAESQFLVKALVFALIAAGTVLLVS